MKTIDLKKTLKPFYSASAAKPAFVDVPALNALMVDGRGDPNSPAFQEAVGSLYSVAYTLKFTFKKEKGRRLPGHGPRRAVGRRRSLRLHEATNGTNGSGRSSSSCRTP